MNFLCDLIGKIYKKFPNNEIYYDKMTGCHNRNYYEDVILKKTERFKIIIFDINNLKDCNDRFGHKYGDEKVRQMAEFVKRKMFFDSARLGGDEFVALMDSWMSTDFLEYCKDFASYGVATHEIGEPVSQAMKRADKNLYIMKGKIEK